MRLARIERVPAHVRNLQVGSDGRDPVDLARDPTQPSVTSYSRPRSAISCMPTQMPKNGRPLRRTVSLERFDHAGDGIEAAAAIGERADAGQHHAIGARDRVGIAGDHDRLAPCRLSRAARSKAFAAECRLPEP